jgi:hypothetical protein
LTAYMYRFANRGVGLLTGGREPFPLKIL